VDRRARVDAGYRELCNLPPVCALERAAAPDGHQAYKARCKGRGVTTLRNQVALVTGAGSGIGKAVALALAAHGATVWLAGRAQEKLEAVAEVARATAGHAHCVQIDLTRDDNISGLAARLRQDVGHLDVLVHCAGEIVLGPLGSASVEDLDRQYRINVRAPYLLTQLLLPMLKSRQGQIVFVNSSAGQTASPNLSQYAATKHALRAIADSLRHEVNPDGIRVVSVYPGRTASPMQAAVHAAEGKDYHPENLIQPQDVASTIVSALILPRSAEVTDIHVRPLRKPT
jgi:NADP-dependent 3-hydroxy acid dehydrogenase YdfG